MPTLVLNNRSPFDCLFQRSHNYHFLHTFWVSLFLRPYHNHKLKFHSSSYVFLGYNSSHLGYCCLDIVSQHIYIFCHIRFHKHIFSFVRFKKIAQSTSHSPFNPTSLLPNLLLSPPFHSYTCCLLTSPPVCPSLSHTCFCLPTTSRQFPLSITTCMFI